MTTVNISFRVTKKMQDKIDRIVESEGNYFNRSSFIRDAIRLSLLKWRQTK